MGAYDGHEATLGFEELRVLCPERRVELLPALLVLWREEIELMSGARFQPASCAGSSRESPCQDGNVNTDAPVPEGGPQRRMLGRPAGKLGVGIPARVSVDESGVVRSSRQGKFPWSEKANGRVLAAAIAFGRKSLPLDPELVAVANLVPLVGKPSPAGLLDDGIEGEQAGPHQVGSGRDSPMAKIETAKSPIDGLAEDVTKLGRSPGANPGQGMLAGNAPLDDPPHESGGRRAVRAVMVGVLAPEKHSGVEAHKPDPASVWRSPAESLQGRGAGPESFGGGAQKAAARSASM